MSWQNGYFMRMDYDKLPGLYSSNLNDHVICSALGIFISLYALYVEVKKWNDPDYVALCDFSDRFSCSKVLTSKYGKGFGIVGLLVGEKSMLNTPNCITGALFFAMQLLLGLLESDWLVYFLLISSIVACLGCLYLAYVLLVILNDLCLVCFASYIFNGLLLYLNYQRFLMIGAA